MGTKVNWMIMILENEAEEAEQTAAGFARETERADDGLGYRFLDWRREYISLGGSFSGCP